MPRLKYFLLIALMFIVTGCQSGNPDKPVQGPALNPPAPVSPAPTLPAPPPKLNPVTGLVSKADKSAVVAVMVENTPEARPQSGLDKAEVVYEMYAEGGITRFMALYHENDATVVGPVRSARTYFVTMVRQWNAGYAHAGGNQDALDLLRKWGIQDLDEIYRLPEPYWRDSSRRAPHNLYTNTERLRRFIKQPGRLPTWPFEEISASGGPAQSVTIPFNSFTKTTYRYDPASGIYLRFIGDRPHADKVTGAQLEAANVIIQYAVHRPGGDEPGAVDITLSGKGRAEYLREGKKYSGYWQKPGLDQETEFFLEDGTRFKLRPGNTWIEVVPTTMKPIYQ